MPKRYIWVEDSMVEVSEEIYKEYYRLARYERYQEERDICKGTLYYEGFDVEDVSGEEMIINPDQRSVEEQIELESLIAQLRKAMKILPENERELIYKRYVENKTFRELEKEIEIPYSNLRRQHNSILEKSRAMID